MTKLDVLDWTLAIGVLLLGWFLAVYFKTKYKVPKREVVAVSFFVAGLAVIIVGIYHVLRGLLTLTP